MGATKSTHFTTEHNEMANLLKAIAHPARVAIVEHLLEVKGCICGEIVTALPLAQPTVSQHLKELKNVGLIKGSIEGNAICYCINEVTVEKLSDYFEKMSQKLKNKSCC